MGKLNLKKSERLEENWNNLNRIDLIKKMDKTSQLVENFNQLEKSNWPK
jgi:hypothetical protein